MTEELDVMEVMQDLAEEDTKQDSQEFEVFRYYNLVFTLIIELEAR